MWQIEIFNYWMFFDIKIGLLYIKRSVKLELNSNDYNLKEHTNNLKERDESNKFTKQSIL